jgi:hypothetical protein
MTEEIYECPQCETFLTLTGRPRGLRGFSRGRVGGGRGQIPQVGR